MRATLLVHLLFRYPQSRFPMMLEAVVMALVIFVSCAAIRRFLWPIEDPLAQSAAFFGMSALLVGAVVGALPAARLHELRACPFSAQLPGLERRAVRELGIVGAILVGAAFVIGGTFFSSSEHAGFTYPAVMVLLGFALGLLVNDPRPGGWNRLAAYPVVFGALLLFFAHEFARVTVIAPLLAIFSAGLISSVLLFGTATWAGLHCRWAERPTGADVDLARQESWRSTPRDGRAPFEGVRRTDWQWTRAMLHEMSGTVRGGWVTSIVFATVWLFVLGIVIVGFAEFLIVRSGGTDAALRDRTFLDLLIAPGRGQRLLVTAVMAWLFATIVADRALRTPLASLYPISRARHGRCQWLITQAQELLILGLSIMLLLAAGALTVGTARALAIESVQAAAVIERGPFHVFRIGVPSMLAVVIVAPIARWVRLRLADGAYGAFWSESGVLGDSVRGLAVVATLIIGATGLHIFWLIAGEQAVTLRWLAALTTVALMFGLRWWWYAALQRAAAACDIVRPVRDPS